MGNPNGPHFLVVTISGSDRKATPRIQAITGLYERDVKGKRVTVIEYGGTDITTDTPLLDVLASMTDDANMFAPNTPAA